jgi:hypothetical protein
MQATSDLLHAQAAGVEVMDGFIAFQTGLPFLPLGSLPIWSKILDGHRSRSCSSDHEAYLLECFAMMGQDALTYIGQVSDEMIPIRHLDRLWGSLTRSACVRSCTVTANDLHPWVAL